mmetsp:Transcript_30029/g.76479  ORF Transcript_30029/g.76479 Transcript_30029/m.76479 type:complete len:217 (-) Transcript_30029:278-928(-)
MSPNLKLHYFDFPGRAEATRLMLNYGGIPFEDATFQREQWASLKPKMPFGQVPVLEVDGKMLAQTSAIERYAAKLAGLAPSDPWEAAKVDEVLGFVAEANDLFAATYGIKDADAKIKARQEVCAGPLKDKFAKVTQMIEAAGGEFLTGSKPTHPDFVLFKLTSGLVGGTMDGVPTDLLDAYPVIKAHHNRVAALPTVAKMYEKVTEGPYLAYKALP